jgi:hypothetical protein
MIHVLSSCLAGPLMKFAFLWRLFIPYEGGLFHPPQCVIRYVLVNPLFPRTSLSIINAVA